MSKTTIVENVEDVSEVQEGFTAEQINKIKELEQEEENKYKEMSTLEQKREARSQMLQEIEQTIDNTHQLNDADNAKMLRQEEEKSSEDSKEAADVDVSSEVIDADETDGVDQDMLAKLDNLTNIRQATRKERRNMYNDDYIIPIGDKLEINTKEKSRQRDFFRLVESKKARKPLTGHIDMVTELNGMAHAVIKMGTYKVYIPANELIDIKGRELEILPGDSNEVRLNKTRSVKSLMVRRIGSEIDFIVKGIDEAGLFAVASRREAMLMKRRAYYLYKDRSTDTYVINEGDIVEARICAVHQQGIIVECFGIEANIRQKELSYVRIADVLTEYSPGANIAVKITKLDRELTQVNGKNQFKLSISVSAKQAEPDPKTIEFMDYKLGDVVNAYVSGIASYGVYVRLGGEDGKMDALCNFPDRIACPQIGDYVQVKITQIDENEKRIYGIISFKMVSRQKNA